MGKLVKYLHLKNNFPSFSDWKLVIENKISKLNSLDDSKVGGLLTNVVSYTDKFIDRYNICFVA